MVSSSLLSSSGVRFRFDRCPGRCGPIEGILDGALCGVVKTLLRWERLEATRAKHIRCRAVVEAAEIVIKGDWL